MSEGSRTMAGAEMKKSPFKVYHYPAFDGQVPGDPDHVYIEFFDESAAVIKRFNCFGGDSGGDELMSGEERLDLAGQLDEPMNIKICSFPVPDPSLRHPLHTKEYTVSLPTNDAGIIYAVNGVCQTMADRILYPSGKTVSTAKGFKVLRFMYGTYGTHIPRQAYGVLKIALDRVIDELPNLVQPIARKAIAAVVSVEWMQDKLQEELCRRWKLRLQTLNLTAPDEVAETSIPSLVEELQALHGEEGAGRPDELLTREHEILVRHELPGLEPEVKERLLVCMKEACDAPFAGEDDKGRIEPKQTAETLNDWINGFLVRAAGLMSAGDFEQLFWIRPAESFRPFEEEAFQALSQTMRSGSSPEFQDAKPL